MVGPGNSLRLTITLAGCASFLMLAGLAGADAYVGASTVVARENGQTVFDNGVLSCSPTADTATFLLLGESVGVGGACLPFDGSAAAVYVEDPTLSDPGEVAYQVCVDNNQDNLCALPETSAWDPLCPDWVRFSHKGPPAGWANPMTNVPTSLLASSDCPGPQPGAWDGLLVFVCSGVHDAHEHKTLSGTASLGGSGGSDGFDPFVDADVFCGPPPGVPAVKAYVVGP